MPDCSLILLRATLHRDQCGNDHIGLDLPMSTNDADMLLLRLQTDQYDLGNPSVKIAFLGLGRWLSCKKHWCYSGKHGFNSEHPDGDSQASVVPRRSKGHLLAPTGTRYAYGTQIHPGKYPYT